jgi:hypothetical protein
MVGRSGFWTYVLDLLAVSGVVCLSFRDRFDILLEKRPSGVAELIYAMSYGKSQVRKERLGCNRAEYLEINYEK